ncbi:ATP-dependent DNA helicase [Mediterraneibacter sp. ICN-202921]|uniref:ATP-dependent DNA helicase n=1 Tax=Mediterraneibacter sp. ICN-202921 TaxID=3134657 RepID=UPI0030C0C3AB
METEKMIKISVRNLVEFILREGDIDNRIAPGMEKDAMMMGSRLHRKIQRRMGEEYHAEVSLKIQIPCEGFLLQVEGRADGIIQKEDAEEATIDEIKGVLRELAHLTRPVSVHLSQAKCYAYMYAKQAGLQKISVQMTYCHLESEEIKQFTQQYMFEELEIWFQDLIAKYEKWARFQIEWRKKRNLSIKALSFPFAYREGQRELAYSVYRTILRRKKLFIQAPTGVGKTMAAVFPTVKAMGEGLGEKIFYLTAKTITRTVAEQAFLKLKGKGLSCKVLTLTAKEKICFLEQAVCNPDACPYAKGHYDRVNEAVFELLTTQSTFTRTVIEEQARKHRVCPFEMSLDVSNWVDAVICDYNYVFDPNAHLKRFFSESTKGEYLFLIDEAHNLVERGRKMYSAVLYKEDFLAAKRLVQEVDSKLAKRLGECNKLLLTLKRECENYQVLESVSHISLKLMNLMGEIERFLEECEDEAKREPILELYFRVRDFINIHDLLDENYVIYTELEPDGRFKLKLFCVNPAVNLAGYLEQGNSTIFFSATLLPIKYYKKLLSVEEEDYAVYAESTFSAENRLLLLGMDVSTKYTRRGPAMYERFADYILKLAVSKKGNYIVFFPSYQFMEDVCRIFAEKTAGRSDLESIMQSQYMEEVHREEFLEKFKENREKTLLGFCVMGGIFSEGIDLSRDRLIGAVIVGTGLPQVCNEREILKTFFEKRNMQGFDFAYLYPGMNKVLQSAGRVIRTEKDRGVILLLDERFLRRPYQEIFPREWKKYQTCSLETVERQIREFWDSQS